MSKAADLTTGIIDHIYKQGGYAWRASSTGIFEEKTGRFRSAPKKGVADVLGLYRGKFMAIEVKIGKDRLSLEQEGFLRNIEHYGGLVFVAKDFESFEYWFSHILDLQKMV
jgi:penicillin-binding protein-related factor A (putative recombinase)